MSANKTPKWNPLLQPHVNAIQEIDNKVILAQSPDKEPGMGFTATLTGIISGKRKSIGLDFYVEKNPTSGGEPILKSFYNCPLEGLQEKNPDECIKEFEFQSKFAFDEHENSKPFGND
jgi:hypothetical protein